MSTPHLVPDVGSRPDRPPSPNGHPETEECAARSAAASQRIIVILYHGVGGGLADDNIDRGIFDTLQHQLEQLPRTPRENTTLDLWLDSPGGDAHMAYKVALLLRATAHRIRVVIPDYAKSAATLLALVGDELYMAPAAELGPLDAQISYEPEGMTISALDRARSLDDLTQTALNIALSGGGAVLQYTRLSRAESINAMLGFAAKFLEPVVSKLDPTLVHWSGALLDVAVEYGARILATHETPDPGLARLPRRLVEEYPTHGFVISMAEAAELGLPVQPLTNYDMCDQAVALHREFSSARINFVTVNSADALIPDGYTNGSGGRTENEATYQPSLSSDRTTTDGREQPSDEVDPSERGAE